MKRATQRTVIAAAIISAAASISSAQKIAGQMIYSANFEAPTYKLGPLVGQDRWTVNPALTLSEAAMVQAKLASEGAQAAQFSAAPLGCVLADWSRPIDLTPGANSIVDIDWDMMVLASSTPARGWGLWVYAGNNTPVAGLYVDNTLDDTICYWTSGVTGVPATTRIVRGEWARFQIHLDYIGRAASFMVNGSPIEPNGADGVPAPYLKPREPLTAIGFRILGPGNDSALIDAIQVTTLDLGCYANCDQSVTPPVLNVNDFLCFQTAFANAQTLPINEQITSYANCDGSVGKPVLTVNDFICFSNRFAQGCM